MMKRSCIFGFLLLVGLVAGQYNYCQAPGINPSENTQGLVLQQLQILTRHGDRTPTGPLQPEVVWNCTLNWLQLASNDFDQSEYVPKRQYRKTYLANREVLLGNCELGQLTEKGYQQHISLGSQIRELYINQYNFLEAQLNLDDIWVRSTDVPRTIQSVMGNFWGIYPPEPRPDGNITVIDIQTMDGEMDDMTPNPSICPQLSNVYAALQNSSEWKNQTLKLAPLLDQLQVIFNSTSLSSWGALWDNLGARTCHNKEVPAGITSAMLDQIYEAAAWINWFEWSDDESGRLGSGMLLQELQARLQQNVAGETQPKFLFYSGHDSTVGPLMGSLGFFGGWPPYASHVEIELWSDSARTQFYVQVKYNGESILMSGCSDVMCDYSDFMDFISTRIPTNFEKECNPPSK